MIDWIDPAHRFLASLFFDHVRYEAGRAGDHENPIERCGVHSQIGEDGADSAVDVDGQSFLRIGERFFNGARCLHVQAVHASLARQLEKPRGTRVFRVIAMTKSRHALAAFPHGRYTVRGRSLSLNKYTSRAV